MADKKIIAIAGATGAQGGGLAHAILDDPAGGFSVRALTRNPSSEKAKALAARGAEVVAADVDDVASVTKAFRGAYGAFCVTFFWEHMKPEREVAQAKALAEGAKSAGIKHAIWSTLEDTRHFIPLSDNRMPTLQGKYKVPHFDAKGEADHYFTDLGVPTTFLRTAFYWENLIYFGMGPKRGPDGKLMLGLPMADKPLAAMASEDIGKIAYAIFKAGDRYIGKTIGVYGEALTGAQMAKSLSKALGEEVRYTPPSFDAFRGYGFPGADDIGNMFQYYAEFEKDFMGLRDLKLTKQFHPSLQTFDKWLERNAEKIPRE